MVKKYSVGLDGREYVFYICGERELMGHHGLINDEIQSKFRFND